MVARIRPYRLDDFAALLALLDATAPGRVSSAADLAWWLAAPGFDAGKDFFLAEAQGDRGIVGARDVRVTGRGDEAIPILESWGSLHPSVKDTTVPDELVRTAMARARSLLGERGYRQGILQVRCDEHDERGRAVVEAAGLQQERLLWTMVKSDLTDVEPPSFPAGFVVRRYRTGVDDELWVDAFNDAFAVHWGGWMGMNLPLWQHYLSHPSFNPALSLVAWHGAEIAGFCHCITGTGINASGDERQGTIRYVGVRARWRGMGLGKALTQAGLIALRDAGMTCCTLGVDGDNVTGAHHLYAQLGFAVVDRQVLYRCQILAIDADS